MGAACAARSRGPARPNPQSPGPLRAPRVPRGVDDAGSHDESACVGNGLGRAGARARAARRRALGATHDARSAAAVSMGRNLATRPARLGSRPARSEHCPERALPGAQGRERLPSLWLALGRRRPRGAGERRHPRARARTAATPRAAPGAARPPGEWVPRAARATGRPPRRARPRLRGSPRRRTALSAPRGSGPSELPTEARAALRISKPRSRHRRGRPRPWQPGPMRTTAGPALRALAPAPPAPRRSRTARPTRRAPAVVARFWVRGSVARRFHHSAPAFPHKSGPVRGRHPSGFRPAARTVRDGGSSGFLRSAGPRVRGGSGFSVQMPAGRGHADLLSAPHALAGSWAKRHDSSHPRDQVVRNPGSPRGALEDGPSPRAAEPVPARPSATRLAPPPRGGATLRGQRARTNRAARRRTTNEYSEVSAPQPHRASGARRVDAPPAAPAPRPCNARRRRFDTEKIPRAALFACAARRASC